MEKLASKYQLTLEDLSFCFQLRRVYYNNNRLIYCSKHCQSIKMKKRVDWYFVNNLGNKFQSNERYVTKIYRHVRELEDIFSDTQLVPVVSVPVSCLFMEISSQNKLVMIPSGVAALDDRGFVAWIEVFRVTDIDKFDKTESFFVAGANRTMVSLETGISYNSRPLAFKESCIPIDKRKEERVFVLLRNNTPLPKWPIAPDTDVPVAIREGVEVHIESRVLRVRRTDIHVDFSSQWMYYEEEPSVRMRRDIVEHIAT